MKRWVLRTGPLRADTGLAESSGLKLLGQSAVGDNHMFRRLTPDRARLAGWVLTNAAWLTVSSLAASSTSSSNASEWVARDAPAVVQLREGVKLTLAPGTRVTRQPTIPVPRHMKELAPRAYAVQLLTGRLDVDIDTSRKPIFGVMVHAPRQVAAFSTGGKSAIVASPLGVVIADISGNDLSGASADKWRSLHVGTALVVSRESPAGSVHELLKRPVLRAANSLKLDLGGSEPTNLSWSEVSDTQSYRVTLYQETPQGSVPVNVIETRHALYELPRLEPGQYTATVSAVDRWNIGSPPSNAVPIRVIGVELPKGAYVYHGIPQLGKLQQVHLSHVEGLEMAYGTASLFGQVPASLGLPTGYPLLVRFREQGASDEVKLMLEPRSIQSSIQFEPRAARWPGQAVKVTVRIFGPEGAKLSESVDVAISTSVNARPIDVHWAHEGSTWITRIEQPPISGPWILRVTASDQVGQVLAHDFIEIALPASPGALSRMSTYSSQ